MSATAATLDPSHPLAGEILAAATEPGQPRLAELLDQAGMPGLVQNPETEQVPPAGQVVLGGRLCDYRVLGLLGASEIMLVERAFSEAFCRELIETAEQADAWAQGSQVTGSGSGYLSDSRTSRNAPVSRATHAQLGRFEDALVSGLGEAARFYGCWNRHVVARRQAGWEIMRYGPGERFGLHVDSIAGNMAWGQRQLSVLVYLGDGYEGGETAFPRQGVQLRPSGAGTVALFPPFSTHPHEARAVTAGMKYVVVGWFYP